MVKIQNNYNFIEYKLIIITLKKLCAVNDKIKYENSVRTIIKKFVL